MDGLQVREIEEVHISDLSVELFEERYAYTHRPLVVRNASISWDAQQVALNKACSIFMRTQDYENIYQSNQYCIEFLVSLVYHSFVQQGDRLQLVQVGVHEKSQADGQRRRRMLVQQVEN